MKVGFLASIFVNLVGMVLNETCGRLTNRMWSELQIVSIIFEHIQCENSMMILT